MSKTVKCLITNDELQDSDALYIIRKTEHGILVGAINITLETSIAIAVDSLDCIYQEAVKMSEDFDMPVSQILEKRLAKLLPEFANKPPLIRQPRPTEQPNNQSYDFNSNFEPIAAQGTSVVVDKKQQSDIITTTGGEEAVNRIRKNIGKQDVSFASGYNYSPCMLCKETGKLRDGAICPKCNGEGEILNLPTS